MAHPENTILIAKPVATGFAFLADGLHDPKNDE